MPGAEILVAGEVVLDVFLPEAWGEPELRLGGIMHAARGLWSVGCPFGIAYIAPDYMAPLIKSEGETLGAECIDSVGRVRGAPSALLVQAPKECGPQGYDFLLRESREVSVSGPDLTRALEARCWTDVLLFPSGFRLEPVLATIAKGAARLHVDVSFGPADWAELRALGRPIEHISVSTSSTWFLESAAGSFDRVVAAAAEAGAQSVLLKENRGGSRFVRLGEPGGSVTTPAQLQPVAHSVGVGDCFDAVFAAMGSRCTDKEALAYASCIAAEYGATTDVGSFREHVAGWLKVPPAEITQLRGVSLPWEVRPRCQIYMAAPDFRDVDTRPLERVVECLRYHNFTPRLPVREHGEVSSDTSPAGRRETYEADLAMLDQCQLVLAVLLYDDPGTLIEIGIAVARDIPVIVYDPYSQARNLMLTESARLVSEDLDAVIGAVFEEAQEVARR